MQVFLKQLQYIATIEKTCVAIYSLPVQPKSFYDDVSMNNFNTEMHLVSEVIYQPDAMLGTRHTNVHIAR